VTQGDTVLNCSGTLVAFGTKTSSGHGGSAKADGALSTSSSSFSAAYAAGNGYNFASGLGSIDVGKLIKQLAPVVATKPLAYARGSET
jgi:hypothetical protein